MLARLLRVSVVLLTLGTALVAFAQTARPARPPLVINSLTGPDLFAFYCATCHGRDGRGNGPVAAALRVPPPDLTLLARQHGGRFPKPRVEAFVSIGEGLLSPAHGTSEMPVWGPIFRGLDPSDALVTIRIANLVAYVESIQAR